MTKEELIELIDEGAQATPGLLLQPDKIKSILLSMTEFLNDSSSGILAMTLDQTGTDDPVVSIVENTTDKTFTGVRTGIGTYVFSIDGSDGFFSKDTTVQAFINCSVFKPHVIVSVSVFDSSIAIYTYNTDTQALEDGHLKDTSFRLHTKKEYV